jgi:hypothetical protein
VLSILRTIVTTPVGPGATEMALVEPMKKALVATIVATRAYIRWRIGDLNP